MSRIVTNVQSLIAQRVLNQNNQGLNNTLERLSTGLRINRGKDDPAGLIASENLRSEATSLEAAIGNAERADQVVNIAEGGLQEVSTLLNDLQGLLTSSASQAGLSDSEREANQLQIDSILQTIDRIAGASSFQGTKLLNGNFDYQTNNVATGVSDFAVNGIKFEGASQDVNVVVTQSAQQGGVYLSLGGAVSLGGAQGSTFTVEITGSLGSRELSFASGTTLAQIAAAVNTFTETTGVEATTNASGSNGGVILRSASYGSAEFVGVRVTDTANIQGSNIGLYEFDADNTNTSGIQTTVSQTFAQLANEFRDVGQDVGGTINGVVATGTGRTLNVNTDFLDVELTLSTSSSDALNAIEQQGALAFSVTGGGAKFQLASRVDIGGEVSIGIKDIATRKLGRSDIGFLDDLGNGKAFNVVDGNNLSTAQKIVSEAIDQISSTRGRLGAFQRNVVGATVRNLSVALENTAAAQSVIRDADFAAETASLTRSQILTQAATNTLSLANQSPQSVLQLLG